MNYQKGLIAPLLLTLIALLLLGGGAYVYTHNKQASQSAVEQASDWKTYGDEPGQATEYPADWIVQEELSYSVDGSEVTYRGLSLMPPVTKAPLPEDKIFIGAHGVSVCSDVPQATKCAGGTYTNSQYGFSLTYPADLKVEANANEKIANAISTIKIYDANYKVPEGAVGQQIRTGQRSVIINILEKSDENLNSIMKLIALGEPKDKADLWSKKSIRVDGRSATFYELWSGLVGTNYESYFSSDKYIFEATGFQGDLLEEILSTFKFSSPTMQASNSKTTDWKTYRNELMGIEVKYPPTYFVASNAGDPSSDIFTFVTKLGKESEKSWWDIFKKGNGGIPPNIQLIYHANRGNLSIADLAKEWSKYGTTASPCKDLTIAGEKALNCSLYTETEASVTHTDMIFLKHNSVTYSFAAESSKSDDVVHADLLEILATLKFLQ